MFRSESETKLLLQQPINLIYIKLETNIILVNKIKHTGKQLINYNHINLV